MDAAFRELGVPGYTEEERAYARRFKATFPLEGQLSDLPKTLKDREAVVKNIRESALCDFYVETVPSDICEMGSTDVGDVSWVVPTCTANTACYSYGAGGHSWQWVAQGKSSVAMKGMLHAGRVIARAAEKLLDDPGLIRKAREELDRRLGGERYRCLIPGDVKPHYFD